jgi:hypothetical protein
MRNAPLPHSLDDIQTLSHSQLQVLKVHQLRKFSTTMAPSATTLVGESEVNARLGALGKTVSGKRLRIRTYPKFETLEEERLYRKQHLAAAFRVFADRGFDEGVAGHMYVPNKHTTRGMVK